MPMLAFVVYLGGKTLNVVVPTSGGAAQWIKAQVGNRKVVALGSVFEQCNIASLGKRHFTRTIPQLGRSIYPL